MSLQEIKAGSGNLTALEHARAAGHQRIMRWKETPGLADELARAHAAMDAGRKVTQEQVEEFIAAQRHKK